MDPGEAIADLKQVSTQVRDVAVADRAGTLRAASDTLGDSEARELARVGAELFDDAVAASAALGHGELSQLEIATPDGSLFVIAAGGRIVVATTEPDPTVGLVFYDLKTCLRAVSEAVAADPGAQPETRRDDGQA